MNVMRRSYSEYIAAAVAAAAAAAAAVLPYAMGFTLQTSIAKITT